MAEIETTQEEMEDQPEETEAAPTEEQPPTITVYLEPVATGVT